MASGSSTDPRRLKNSSLHDTTKAPGLFIAVVCSDDIRGSCPYPGSSDMIEARPRVKDHQHWSTMLLCYLDHETNLTTHCNDQTMRMFMHASITFLHWFEVSLNQTHDVKAKCPPQAALDCSGSQGNSARLAVTREFDDFKTMFHQWGLSSSQTQTKVRK